MYLPSHFDEPRLPVLHELIRARPLATLVTLAGGAIEANHVPLHLSPHEGPFGTLRGHVARANGLWRETDADGEVLAIFQGPDAYVTPSWYPTKAETGKAVPTWNYAVVHARGRLRVHDDDAWLRAHLAAMTAEREGARAEPWRLEDAPADYTNKLIGAIVGIEIVITRLAGKWKTSQNQPPRNRAGVARGLRSEDDSDALEMAALVRAEGPPTA